jgi:hypothetical protein
MAMGPPAGAKGQRALILNVCVSTAANVVFFFIVVVNCALTTGNGIFYTAAHVDPLSPQFPWPDLWTWHSCCRHYKVKISLDAAS